MPLLPNGTYLPQEAISARVQTARGIWGRILQLATERGIPTLAAEARAELAKADELEKLL